MANKKIVIIFIALTVLYWILCLSGVAGTAAALGGMVHYIVCVCILLIVCFRVFIGAAGAGGGPFFAGAFGLGTLAVNEVYSLVYLYVWRGDSADITVAHFNRNCALLFFIAALLALLRGTEKRVSVIKFGAGVISCVPVALIFYAILINYPPLLYRPALINVVLCISLSVCVFFQNPRSNASRAFACSVSAICALESAYRLMIIYNAGPLWRDFVDSFYPLAYIFLGLALLCMRERGERCE